jgi:uncharacterized protein (DUF488 family)
MKKVFTIGYEDVEITRFIEILKENGVKTLVDIRKYPVSDQEGFEGSALKFRCRMGGIEYIHIKALGNPKKYWGESNWKTLYRDNVLRDKMEGVAIQLGKLVQPIVLMCKEKDHCKCHRSVLAEELGNRGVQIKHIDCFIRKGDQKQSSVFEWI